MGTGTSFYRKSKINVKRKPNYDKAGFIIDQWSFHNSMPFTLQTMIFRYNYKSNDGFYLPNSFYKVHLTALKNSKLKWIVWGTYCNMYSTAYNLWTFIWFLTPFQAERDWQNSYRGISKFHSNLYSILFDKTTIYTLKFYCFLFQLKSQVWTNERLVKLILGKWKIK